MSVKGPDIILPANTVKLQLIDVCRVCLKASDEHNSFFDFVEWTSDMKLELRDVYKTLTKIEINHNDSKPQQICNSCTEKLCICYEFLSCAQKSEDFLGRYVNQSKAGASRTSSNFDNSVEEEDLGASSAISNDAVEVLDDEEESRSRSPSLQDCGDYQMLDEFASLLDENEAIEAGNEACGDEEEAATTQKVKVEYLVYDGVIENDLDSIKSKNEYKVNRVKLSKSADDTEDDGDTCTVYTVEYDSEGNVDAKKKNESAPTTTISVGPVRTDGLVRFPCEMCQRIFAKKETLERHISKVHTFVPREVIVAKAPKPTPEQPFQCAHCPRVCANKNNLRRHILAVHPDLAPQEEVDDEEHKQQKEYKRKICTYCGESFPMASLIIHLRRHRGEKPYKCDECDKGFPRRQDLMIHKRQHSGERPHVCTVCGKAFIRPNKLSRHMRIHLGIRPYPCKECGKSFSQSNDLKIHKRRHTGEKPYVCGICQQGFISGTMLKQHRRQKGHHEPESELADPYAACRLTARPPPVLEEIELCEQ